MNKLILALIVFTTATLTWLNRYSVARTAGNDVRALSRQLLACENTMRTEHANSAALDHRLAQLRELARDAQQELGQASAEARELTSPVDFSAEGAWPAARDYFYLPKQFLGTLGYNVFQNDGSLSDEAAQLFGLTPAEKVALADSWRQLRLQLQQLELDHAEQLDASQPDSGDHREVAFHLPSLTNEITQVRQQFEQDLEKQLGNTRGQLIWEKVAEEKPLSGYPFGYQEQIVTYSADRMEDGSVQHKLGLTNPSRLAAYCFPINFDPPANPAVTPSEAGGSPAATGGNPAPLSPDSALWNYRHLFGTDPLLTPRHDQP